jgi:hypothetical protein
MFLLLAKGFTGAIWKLFNFEEKFGRMKSFRTN